MKKIMLAIALTACTQMMAMDQTLATLRKEIEERAEKFSWNPVGCGGDRNRTRTWKRAYILCAFESIKEGKSVTPFLGGPKNSEFNHAVWENYCLENHKGEETVTGLIEKSWQEIHNAVLSGALVIKKDHVCQAETGQVVRSDANTFA